MNDGSPSAIVKQLFPNIPFLLKTAVFHSLRLSHTSSKWDLRTELTIRLIQRMLNGETVPISKQQRATLKDPGIKGPMWISKVTFPCPAEDDLRQLLFSAIDDMKIGSQTYTPAPPQPLEAEWTGYRANVGKDAPPPDLSEKEKYDNLVKETSSDTTLLYFHGGAYFLLDPAFYRPVTSKFAHLTGGRVFSVRYRLAPQNPFPAALLDALTAYLSLLYPPPNAPHDPVPASDIVFGGDSAGGNLASILMLTLLHFHRKAASTGKPPVVTFNGKQVEIPLPAGMALCSPWLDQTRSLPSMYKNADYDYLPTPAATQKNGIPKCSIWPVDPPRTTFYCDGDILLHPLVSPLLADFTGCPPVYIVCGEEMLQDEDLLFAKRLHAQGVTVVLNMYDAMPHCFALLLEGLEAARQCIDEYAAFCKTVAEKPDAIVAGAFRIAPKSLAKTSIDPAKLTDLTDSQALEMMRKAQHDMIEWANGTESTARNAVPML